MNSIITGSPEAGTFPGAITFPGQSSLPTHWYDSLRKVVADLDKLPAATEGRFLEMGERLLAISTRIEEIGATANRASALIGGEELLAVIDGLRRILDRMEVYALEADRKAVRAVATLQHIELTLGNVRRYMLRFSEQVSSLRMLKMMTNIQSAGLGKGGAGFAKVAFDIQMLSLNVQQKSSDIIGESKVLKGHLDHALVMAIALESRQRHLAGVVVQDIRSGIAALLAMHTNCSDAAVNVSGRSGEISLEISEVVIALQFHDITRQQLEHARDALIDLLAHADSHAGSARRGADVPGRTVSALEAAAVCELQSVQVANAADELAVAVRRIVANLRHMASSAAGTAGRAHEMAGFANRVGDSALAGIERGLTSVMAVFADSVTTNRELVTIMLAVVETMGRITLFLEDIDTIGSEIKLIALNASIKAAQAGKDGAALGVIAATVKRQSEEICAQSSAVIDAIVDIIDSVEQLREEIESGSAAATSDQVTGEMLLRLEESLDGLRGVHASIVTLLTETDAMAGSLTTDIEEVLAGMTAADVLATVHSGVIPRLRELALSARRLDPAAAEPARRGTLHTLEGRYTMRSERRIHQAFSGTGGHGEKRLTVGSDVPVMDIGSDGIGFGDNVELF